MRHALAASTGVRAMLGAFGSLGLDTACIQREAGLDDDVVHDPDRLVPSAQLFQMWGVADRLWARPGLGLSAAAAVPIGAYEVLDYLMLSAATLGEGLADLSAYYALATHTATYRVVDEGPVVACEMAWRIPPEGVMFHLRDYSLFSVARRAREASGAVPAQVDVAGPPLAGPDVYQRAFGTRVCLRAPRNALLFSRAAWDAPVTGRDAFLHRMLRRHAELLLARWSGADADDVVERVRRELLRVGRVGMPEVDDIARALGVGVRTLQRQLRAQGTSVARLTDDVRVCLARQYLADHTLTVAEVAYLLGFSEPSAFTRAFRRWTGTSPQRFRRPGV
jgi:AraC-like DNA-binding protein